MKVTKVKSGDGQGPIPPTTLQLYTMHFTLCQTTLRSNNNNIFCKGKIGFANT
jgi:hypothetical protein